MADDLFIKLHQLSLKAFPEIERFALGRQIRRAAYSVAANIVEAFASPAGRRRVNFLQIAKSSLAEVGYCIHAAHRLAYVAESVKREVESEIRQVGAPLAGLIRLERQKIVTGAARGLSVLAFLSVKIL